MKNIMGFLGCVAYVWIVAGTELYAATVVNFDSDPVGSPPPAPWAITVDGESSVAVTDAAATTGSRSLALSEELGEPCTAKLPVNMSAPAGMKTILQFDMNPSIVLREAYNYTDGGFVAINDNAHYWAAGFLFEVYDADDLGGSYLPTPNELHIKFYKPNFTTEVVGYFTPGTWYHFVVTFDYEAWTNTLRVETMDGSLIAERVCENPYHVVPMYIEFQGATTDKAYVDSIVIETVSPPAPVTLTVVSAHGSPVPAVGSDSYVIDTEVICSVSNVTDGATNYTCTGWTGTGSVPATGTSNAVTVTMAEDSSITWLWQTNYWLDVNVIGNGSVDPSEAFYAKDSEQTLTATPDTGWLFMGWSGDAAGTDQEAHVTMNAPKTVTATFSDDADGDGLTNTQESTIGSDPWNPDTDEDGFDDKAEVDQGGNPTVSDQWRIDYIKANGSTFDLYPSNVVLHIALGEILLEAVDGVATLYLQLEQSGDLESWTNAGEAVMWEIESDSSAQFFRVRSEK